MNIKNRAEKLESEIISNNKPPCFCVKGALLKLWIGEIENLSSCRNCQHLADYWQQQAQEAIAEVNLTDSSEGHYEH